MTKNLSQQPYFMLSEPILVITEISKTLSTFTCLLALMTITLNCLYIHHKEQYLRLLPHLPSSVCFVLKDLRGKGKAITFLHLCSCYLITITSLSVLLRANLVAR